MSCSSSGDKATTSLDFFAFELTVSLDLASVSSLCSSSGISSVSSSGCVPCDDSVAGG